MMVFKRRSPSFEKNPYKTNGTSAFLAMHCRAPPGGDAGVKTGLFASVGNVRYQVWQDVFCCTPILLLHLLVLLTLQFPTHSLCRGNLERNSLRPREAWATPARPAAAGGWVWQPAPAIKKKTYSYYEPPK